MDMPGPEALSFYKEQAYLISSELSKSSAETQTFNVLIYSMFRHIEPLNSPIKNYEPFQRESMINDARLSRHKDERTKSEEQVPSDHFSNHRRTSKPKRTSQNPASRERTTGAPRSRPSSPHDSVCLPLANLLRPICH